MTYWVSLEQLSSGQHAVVRTLSGGHELTARLTAMGIAPGVTVEVLQNARRGALLVRVRDTRIALGRGEASKILVEATHE